MIKTKLGRHKIIWALVIVVLVVAGYFAYQAMAAGNNKQAFVQARAAIDTVYADIVTKVGKPDNYKRTNSCSRPSQEFTQGPLSCHVDTSFVYGVSDKEQADDIFKKTQAEINKYQNLLQANKYLSAGITRTLVANTYYYATSDSYKIHGLNCMANYIFDTPQEVDLSVKNKETKPLEIVIGCHGLAKNQYYPLMN